MKAETSIEDPMIDLIGRYKEDKAAWLATIENSGDVGDDELERTEELFRKIIKTEPTTWDGYRQKIVCLATDKDDVGDLGLEGTILHCAVMLYADTEGG